MYLTKLPGPLRYSSRPPPNAYSLPVQKAQPLLNHIFNFMELFVLLINIYMIVLTQCECL